MTSKSKSKYHQLNLNLNQYSKLKDGISKIKNSTIDNLYQTNQVNSKKDKAVSNININLNLNKQNKNIQNNLNNNPISTQKNLSNNPNITNSNSFRQAELLTKKYKTSKNSRKFSIKESFLFFLLSYNKINFQLIKL